MILRLTDGTLTTNLTGGTDDVYRAEYVPRGPELSAVEFEPATILDGGEVASLTRRNVTEQCEVVITSTTKALVQAALAEIETFFMRAIEWQNRRGGARVWLEFSTDDSTIYRSEILYGRVELGEKSLRNLTGGPALAATLIWRRRYFWEGAEVAVTISNTHGSATTGVAVSNYLDATHHNYVNIANTQITGALPAPARIEFTNTYAGNLMGNVIVGHNVYADLNTLVPELECEDSIWPATVTADATCAGGDYMALALVTSQEVLLKWSLTSAELSRFRGRFFRLFLRLQSAPAANTYLQPRLLLTVSVDYSLAAEGQETLLNTGQRLQDLGTMQIPPYLMGDTGTFYGMDLAIYGRAAAAASLNADYLYLMPLDSYRELRPRAAGLAQNMTLIDDGIADSLWATGYGVGTELVGHYYGLGPQVMLIPGKQQRLHFLMSGISGTCEIARTGSVVVKYRPRRVTV